MDSIKAFVGHSFNKEDKDVIDRFLKFFDSLKETIGFEWDHAEKAEAKALSEKVRDKMEGKNLFIGIFTQNGLRVNLNNVKKLAGHLFAPAKVFRPGTSEWIIQESGYGLAKCGRLLFLVEEGIEITAGLQGDIEYIPFNKGRPELCFTKLNEIFGSLIPSKITEKKPEEKSIPPKDTAEKISEPEKQEDQILDLEPNKKNWIKSWKSLYNLIIKEKEFEKSKHELDTVLERHKDDEKFGHIYWKSLYYYMKCIAGESDGFEELSKLCKMYPDSPIPYEHLGYAYTKYNNYVDAAKNYLLASKHPKKLAHKIQYIGSASEAYAKDSNFQKAYDLLYNSFIDHDLSNSDAKILYEKLCNIAKIEENDTLYTCFAEKVLGLDPTDSDMRFSLAYRYSELDNHSFTLHHYKMLCDTKPNGTNWNNIGVVYGNLDMKHKSVIAYKKAADEFGETLAMSNLAHNYMEKGFLDDAKEILEKARKQPEYNQNIDSKLASFHQIIDNEKSSEEKILRSIENEKKFMIKFAEAYSLPVQVNIDGKWRSKHGEIPIEVNGNKIKGTVVIDPPAKPAKPAKPAMPNTLLGMAMAQASPKRKSITLTGEIRNRGIIYSLRIYVDEANALIRGLGNTNIYEGLMVISDNFNIIDVMEKNEEKQIVFYQMTKVENNID